MNATVRDIVLRLKQPFTIATGTSLERRTFVLTVRDASGVTGEGEATPLRYLGEDHHGLARELEDIRAFIEAEGVWIDEQLATARPPKTPGSPLDALEATLRERFLGARAARTAASVAFHDLLARRLGLPLATVLGIAAGRSGPTAVTVPIDTPERMKARAVSLGAAGHGVLKVKVGRRPEEGSDAEIILALREVHDGPLLVDANGGWSVEYAIAQIRAMTPACPTFVEQPIPRGRPQDLRRIRESVDVPLFADEDALDPNDLPALVGAVDGINIKLMKAGGLGEALRMVHRAREEGWGIMLGCMVESSLGIAAAVPLANLVDFLDLDAPFLIANDPYAGVEYAEGRPVPPRGIGVGAFLRPS